METLQQQDVQVRRAGQHRAGWAPSLGVAALAVAAAVGVRLSAMALGIDVRVETGGTEHGVGVGAVVLAGAVAAVSAVLVLELALRRFVRGRRWWTLGALVVLVGSLASPLQATTTAAWLVLSLLHLVTAAVVILGLRRVSA